MTLSMTTAVRSAMMTAIATGAGGGNIVIYTGTQPASANAAAVGTILVTLPIPTALGATSGTATLTLGAVTATNAVATGTAGWFRVTNFANTTTLFDGSIATSGSDLNMSTTAFVSGASISITSFTILCGNA